MGALLGITFGGGLLLLWIAMTGEHRPSVHVGRTGGSIDAMLRRANVEGVNAVGLLSLCVTAFMLAGFVVLLISRTPIIAAIFGVMAAYAPVAVLRGRGMRRSRELGELWPETVDNLASAIRAGLSLPEALVQLGERGPEPLREPFVKFARDYQASGRFDDSLGLLKERLADPTGDRVIEALRIARDVGGGDLGRMLRSLSSFLRDDARTRAELEARQAWTVNGARLAVAAPWCVLLLMSLQQGVVSHFATPTGSLVLIAGAITCVVAYRLMVRLGRLPTEHRVLS